MKTLYESILSSTHVGKFERIKEELTEWLEKFVFVPGGSNNNSYSQMKFDHIEFEDNLPVVYVECGDLYTNSIRIIGRPFPTKIKAFRDQKGNTLSLSIRVSEIVKMDSLPEEYTGLEFYGCTIDTIDKISDKCTFICFNHANSLSGGNSCNLKGVKNITCDEFGAHSWSYNGKRDVNCLLKDFNHCDFSTLRLCCGNFMCSRWGTISRGALSVSAKDELNEFIKNNKMPKHIYYYVDAEESKTVGCYEIFYKKNDWHLKISTKR